MSNIASQLRCYYCWLKYDHQFSHLRDYKPSHRHQSVFINIIRRGLLAGPLHKDGDTRGKSACKNLFLKHLISRFLSWHNKYISNTMTPARQTSTRCAKPLLTRLESPAAPVASNGLQTTYSTVTITPLTEAENDSAIMQHCSQGQDLAAHCCVQNCHAKKPSCQATGLEGVISILSGLHVTHNLQ